MELEIDHKLAEQYGSYASFTTPDDPIETDAFGDGPTAEVDRLLNKLATPTTNLLDLGCGAGQTLCRLAPLVDEIWGFDENKELLSAAQQRVSQRRIENATLMLGNVALREDVAKLPDNRFNLVLSRRGPDINESVLEKLTSDALLIQELVVDPLGLKEMMGREPFAPQVGNDPHWLIYQYRWIGFLPVSVKDYFYEQYFRDLDHFGAYLKKEAMLSHWRMPQFPYEPERDADALALYAKYNTTPKGIRLLNHRKVYLFRRTPVPQYPAIPDAKPLY